MVTITPPPLSATVSVSVELPLTVRVRSGSAICRFCVAVFTCVVPPEAVTTVSVALPLSVWPAAPVQLV